MLSAVPAPFDPAALVVDDVSPLPDPPAVVPVLRVDEVDAGADVPVDVGAVVVVGGMGSDWFDHDGVATRARHVSPRTPFGDLFAEAWPAPRVLAHLFAATGSRQKGAQTHRAAVLRHHVGADAAVGGQLDQTFRRRGGADEPRDFRLRQLDVRADEGVRARLVLQRLRRRAAPC